MYKKYRRYKKEESFLGDIIGLVATLLSLFVMYLALEYFVNKEKFWYLMNHYTFPALGILAIIFSAYIYILFQNKKKRENHFESILKQISEKGFEDNVNSFIDRFKNEGKVNSWEYRGYNFDWKRLEDFRENITQHGIAISTKDYHELVRVLRYFIDQKEKNFLNAGIETRAIHSLSELSKRGDDFEHLIVRLYNAMGYTSKRVGGHGDQGADVLASKNGENILIQAKCYQGSVGNAAVQQASAAVLHYGCSRAAVVTTSFFTAEAVALAKSNSIELIDGNLLKQKLIEHLHEVWQ